MRRILVDHARQRSRLKRGGDRQRIDFGQIEVAAVDKSEQVLALDAALVELEAVHPEKARVVKLRYFGGLTQEETAQAMDISISTVERHWAFARAWLYRDMRGEQSNSAEPA
jgi:RNA polymerase sigma factor (TIGR02999 family)